MGDERYSRLALLRFSGEMGIKARVTRRQFRSRLLHNLEDALARHGIPPRIEVSHDRIFVALPDDVPGPDLEHAWQQHPLARIFGFQSLSIVERRPPSDLAAIVRDGTCALPRTRASATLRRPGAARGATASLRVRAGAT